MAHSADVYRDLAERSWAWVVSQVRSDEEGLWLPENPGQAEPGEYPFGMHSGVGGLAHVLAEIRLTRDLTADEAALGDEIAATLVRRIPGETEYDYFDGLASTIGVLTALDAPGADLAVARLRELATPDGWPASFLGPPRAVPDARCNDATLGTAERAARRAVGAAARRAGRRRRSPTARSTCCWPRRWRCRPGSTGRSSRSGSCSSRARRCRTGRTAWPGSPGRSPRPAYAARPARPGRRGPARRRAPGHPRRHQRRRLRLAARDPRPGGPRHLHLHLVPRTRPARRCSSPPSTAPGFPRWPAARRTTGSARACTRCRSPASPSAATPASGTTTVAAAVRRASATWCSTCGSGTARDDELAFATTLADAIVDRADHRRRPRLLALRRAPQRRPAPPARRRAGCRARPASRRTSSASPGSSSRAATPPPSPRMDTWWALP